MPDALDVHSVAILHKLGLTEDMVRDHVLHPHEADAAAQLELHEAGDVAEVFEPPPSGLLYELDVEGLRRDLHALLSPCLAGYALQLRRYGRVMIDDHAGPARTRDDGDVAWGPGVKMHVASASKLITAMAMTKVLHSRNISPNATIARWLPAHWVRGPGVDRLTFRQLLTHTSGLVALDEPGRADYQFMKDEIARGVVGGTGYRNINYSLCRILISTIDAPFLFDLLPTVNDNYWDLTTIRHYRDYVQENVFDPVGVTSAFTHATDHALAYPFPVDAPGQATGDLSTMSGAVGWHLSVDDLLAIMAAFRRLGTIVDPARAQTMLDLGFGLDTIPDRDTLLGRIYTKGGFWSFPRDKVNGVFVQQTNAFFLPKGMELVILANSPLCHPDTGFRDRVLEAIRANIHLRLATIAVTAVAAFALAGLVRQVRAPGRP